MEGLAYSAFARMARELATLGSQPRFPAACGGVSEQKKKKYLIGDRRLLAASCDELQSENLDQSINIKELERLFWNEETIVTEMYLDAIPKQKKMILDALSVVIVIFKPKTRVDKAKIIYDLNCLASVWACIKNFLLSLAEHDVYGVTFIPLNTEVIKDNLGIPDELEIASIIPIGYRAKEVRILKQKVIDITERIYNEKW